VKLSLTLTDKTECTILVKKGAHKLLGSYWKPEWQDAVILGDEQVIDLYGDAVGEVIRPKVVHAMILSFPPGDENKNRAVKEDLEDSILSQGYSRRTCVVALGGGVSLDMAGYVAGTYMRGIPYLSVPTSLLAMVDAAIGGKTGVNTEAGKNLVGVIHQPGAVLIDPDLLKTLPPEEWCNGLAEIVKTALVGDAALFEWLETHVDELTQPGRIPDYPLEACVARKSDIVEKDPREGGVRAVLNFGHTIGHAIEKVSEHAIPHGKAVAMGMEVEARVAVSNCRFPAASSQRLFRLLQALGFHEKPDYSFEQLLPYLKVDKKNRGGEIRMALPRRVGEMAGATQGYTLPVSLEEARQAWESGP
jgi:3-dehydroquinate synthase